MPAVPLSFTRPVVVCFDFSMDVRLQIWMLFTQSSYIDSYLNFLS